MLEIALLLAFWHGTNVLKNIEKIKNISLKKLKLKISKKIFKTENFENFVQKLFKTKNFKNFKNFKKFPDFENLFGKAGRAGGRYHVEQFLKFGRPY